MAKFYGAVGYVESKETSLGVWKDQTTECLYYGELVRNAHRFQMSDQLNDNVNVANEISIIADNFANENFYSMRYVVFMGIKWKITNVDVQYPRLILTIGGVYNG